jgi:hypothetical protein
MALTALITNPFFTFFAPGDFRRAGLTAVRLAVRVDLALLVSLLTTFLVTFFFAGFTAGFFALVFFPAGRFALRAMISPLH